MKASKKDWIILAAAMAAFTTTTVITAHAAEPVPVIKRLIQRLDGRPVGGSGCHRDRRDAPCNSGSVGSCTGGGKPGRIRRKPC